jgi:hypothetical protein
MSQPIVNLDYGLQQSRVRRRWRRILICASLIGIGLATSYWWEDIVSSVRKAQMLHAQQRCLEYQIDPARVVYDEDNLDFSKLLAQPRYSIPADSSGRKFAAVWQLPPELRAYPFATDKLYNYGFHRSGAALLFMHERTTPGGHRVLVCALAWVYSDFNASSHPLLYIDVRAYAPATWHTAPQIVGGICPPTRIWRLDPNKPVRLYGGRSDPSDASRFNVDYELFDGSSQTKPSAPKRGTFQGRTKDKTRAFAFDFPIAIEFDARDGDPGR